MRLLVALVLVVFVGLLDDSLARRLTRRNAQLIVPVVQRIARSPLWRPYDVVARRLTRSVENDLGSSEEMAEECAKNAGPNAYASAEFAYDAAIGRVIRELDIFGDFATTYEQMEEQDSIEPIVSYVCQKKHAVKTFVTSAIEAVKICLDVEAKDQMNILATIGESFVEYACQRNGHNISEFLNSDGLECIETRQVALASCADHITDSDEETSNEVDTEDADCTVLTTARNCVQTETRKCPNARHATFVVGFIDFFLNQIC